MTTSGGLFHIEAGWRGRCSVAVTSRISEYAWMRIVSVGPCAGGIRLFIFNFFYLIIFKFRGIFNTLLENVCLTVNL